MERSDHALRVTPFRIATGMLRWQLRWVALTVKAPYNDPKPRYGENTSESN